MPFALPQPRDKRGRYRFKPPCHGCGKPVRGDYWTDDEVCQGSDDPGFILCLRRPCMKRLLAMSVGERRRHYAEQCASKGGSTVTPPRKVP